MKFFLRFVAPLLAILWLAQVHPLGAVVAILLCIVRCAFKSHLCGRLFAHFIYDILKGSAAAVARLVLGRSRGEWSPAKPKQLTQLKPTSCSREKINRLR
jgi:hypothetical protein